MIARLRESATIPALGALGLCLLLLLADVGGVAAQDGSTRPFSVYRLLPDESRDDEPWMVSAAVATDVPLRFDEAETATS